MTSCARSMAASVGYRRECERVGRLKSGCLLCFGVCPSSKMYIAKEASVQGGAEEGVIYKKRKRERGMG